MGATNCLLGVRMFVVALVFRSFFLPVCVWYFDDRRLAFAPTGLVGFVKRAGELVLTAFSIGLLSTVRGDAPQEARDLLTDPPDSGDSRTILTASGSSSKHEKARAKWFIHCYHTSIRIIKTRLKKFVKGCRGRLNNSTVNWNFEIQNLLWRILRKTANFYIFYLFISLLICLSSRLLATLLVWIQSGDALYK